MALFLAHSLILLGASTAAAMRLARPAADRFLAALLLAWGNIVVTCLALAALHHLDSVGWFFRSSLLLALATWLAIRRWMPPPPVEPTAAGERPARALVAAFVLTLAPIAYIGIRIACTYVPNNYDTLSYHLPRAMYYLGQGTLAHFDTGNDRQIYFPFNYNLLQLFGLIYSPPWQVLNSFNLFAWAAAGAAVFRLARLSGFGGNAALIAAWFVLTATQVLAQGTATTNDLPTGAGLLATLVFLLRWRSTRRRRDAWLAGLAVGLATGSKLTVIFFVPAAGLLLAFAAWAAWRRGALAALGRDIRAWLLPAVLATALTVPFAAINVVAKGRWMNTTYDFTLNRPFSVACAVQTAEAYLVQLFLEPLHRFAFDLQLTADLNAWGARTFFPHWHEAYAFSPLFLFPPDLNEDHVWFGFTGPGVLLAAVFCLLRRRRLDDPATWCAALGLGWLFTYFLLNKWSLYNQRYFVPSILVMGPCLAAVVEAGLGRPAWHRATRNALVALAAVALWLSGVYLFQNTSRPYAPLWADQPAPPALPTLPDPMRERLPQFSRVNVHSTDGNERIFLLMSLGRDQRYTSHRAVRPDAYNVFSEWGFPRKVAYSNIEQLSTYTIVDVPAKRTAGIEYLGTIGQGQPALDYYGLVPYPDTTPASENNRKVLVELSYAPRNPGRYSRMQARVVGLNPADDARLALGVDYEDGTSETLATFDHTGDAPAPVTRPFRRFTVRVTSRDGSRALGRIDIPYLFRDKPPDVETPFDPELLFADELVAAPAATAMTVEGLANPEGPYPQWDLPTIRWAKAPVTRITVPGSDELRRIEVAFSLRLQARERAQLDVVFNGTVVRHYDVADRTRWTEETLQLTAQPGPNVIEFRNVSVGVPDWLDYLERYPDVKAYVVSQKIPLEQGAQTHWETFGHKETRTLKINREVETEPSSLYFAFRSLRVGGFR